MTSDQPGPGEPGTGGSGIPPAPGTPAGFRRLLGLAPAGRIAALRALLAGESALDGLVRTSALPRRDVEDFLGALAGSGEDAAPDRRRLTPAVRDQYGRLLDDYVASRPGVMEASRADLLRAASDLVAGVPAPRKRFDHVQATPETLVGRVEWLTENFALSGRSVVFIGDHDVTSLLLSQVVPDATLTVVDIDERLLAHIDSRSGPAVHSGSGVHGGSGAHGGSGVQCVYADLRFGLPPALAGSADLVFTDPPYTPEGLGLFLTRSLAALRRDEPDARIVIAYGHSRRRPDLGAAAQREIIRQDVVIDGMFPAFNRYAGAQAVGSASDLYSCQPTARAFRRLDHAAEHGSGGRGSGAAERGLGIYTHGEQSVESRPNGDLADVLPDLLPVLGMEPGRLGVIVGDRAPAGTFAVTAGLGKLLDEGLHPSVTRRADEILVDLRDDPGPWLLRAMLALNAERAIFLVDAKHEALRDLTLGTPPRPGSAAAAGPWSLPRAKYAAAEVSPAGDGSLTVIRCDLRDAAADDPGLGVTRYILHRAHGKLLNVWREGLVTISARTGAPLTKRQARDLAESRAVAAMGDRLARHVLSLRLIDVPAGYLPGLGAALAASVGPASGDHG